MVFLASRSRLPLFLRGLLLLAFALVASACNKSGGDYGYSASPVDAGSNDYAGEEYLFEEDDMDGEVLSPEGANLSTRGRSRHASLMSTRGSFAADTPSAADASESPPSSSTPASESAGGSDEPDPRTRPSSKRQVIYSASMQVSVYQVNASVDYAEALPEHLGGWVQSREDNIVVLRIPAAELERAMELIAELGIVDRRTLEALDVTAKYTDLDSRIRVLQETQAQLQKLLDAAENVEQALEIRKALDAVTMELERMRAQLRQLSESIAFSTLALRFVARTPEQELPSSNDPFTWVVGLGVEVTEYR